jgi:hypothetical protein
MTQTPTDKAQRRKTSQQPLHPEHYARLKAEAKAPYKALRYFIYLAFGTSGLIGALVFLAQLAAGRDVSSALPNFALQVGIVYIIIWLFRQEKKN